MASIYDIKPAFQKLLRPLTSALAAAGVTANPALGFCTDLLVRAGAARELAGVEGGADEAARYCAARHYAARL